MVSSVSSLWGTRVFKGIKIFDTEVKLSTYADDSTVYLNVDRDSLSGVVRVLDWF